MGTMGRTGIPRTGVGGKESLTDGVQLTGQQQSHPLDDLLQHKTGVKVFTPIHSSPLNDHSETRNSYHAKTLDG